MFRCRPVGDDVKLLEANYTQQCFQPEHNVFYAIGWFFLCTYTLGIPCFILYKLTSFQTTILGKPASKNFQPAVGRKGKKGYRPQVGHPATPGNPNYIEIAPFKPLFQFFKPECYRFEVYFWMEKVLLVGFTEMFGNWVGDSTGITQWMLNMAVTLFYLLLVTKYTPMKTPQYNSGYLLMHVLIIYFYTISLLLNPRVNLQDSAVDNIEWIDRSLVVFQCALLIFLLVVSFLKLDELWKQAKAQVLAERQAEELVEEHVEYFEQLRVHFSDSVAIALTNAHHYGGFGAVIGDMSSQKKLGKALSQNFSRSDLMLARANSMKREAAATFSNPMHLDLDEMDDDETWNDSDSDDEDDEDDSDDEEDGED